MDDYFDINNNILKIAGLWFPSYGTPSEKIIYYVYNIIIALYTCILYPICESLVFNESLKDLQGFMLYFKLFTTHIWGSVKFVLWHHNRNQIFKIIMTLRKSGVNQDSYTSDRLKKSLKESVLVNRLRTLCTALVAGGFSVVGCTGPIAMLIFNADSLYENRSTVVNNCTEQMITKNLPYLSWIPFEYQYSRFVYFLAILFQSHPIFQQGIMIAAFDTYYFAILSYITMQFRVIHEAIRSIRKRSLEKLAINQTYLDKDCLLLTKQINHEMKKVTIRIQLLLKTCDDIEDIFTYLILGQTMFSLVTLCCCLVAVTTLPLMTMNFAKELIYLTATISELFIFSFFGNLVTDDAQEIPNALLDTDWYTSDISFKRSILINMARLQRPIYFTIGKFQPISLSTFVSISKAAYSFCAVVKNMSS